MSDKTDPSDACTSKDGESEVGSSTKEDMSAVIKMPYVSKGKQVDSAKLLQSAKREDFALVKKILDTCQNLDIDLADEVGKTVLHYMSNHNWMDELTLCLTKGNCDINKADKLGWSALHYAAIKGHAPIVEVLVNHGANCNVTDKQQGKTPLHYAVSRDNKAVAELLIECGANAYILDKNAKQPPDICKNELMKSTLEQAINKAEENKSGTVSETLDIALDKPTPFSNLGLTVDPKPAEGTVNNHVDAIAFKMSIRRLTPGSSNINFGIAEIEEVCSDVFTYMMVGKVPGTLTMDLDIPISGPPEKNEELVMKTNKQEEISVLDVLEEDEKWTCKVTADVTIFNSFIVICRPKQERFQVGQQACSIQSTVDDRVEMDIPKGTFGSATTITMEITEPPKNESLDIVLKECADIKGITSFYSLEADSSLQKQINVKVPLPSNYTGTKNLTVFSMDSPLDEEKPDKWKILSVGPQIKQDRLEFDVGSFSIKCVSETESSCGDDISLDLERSLSTLSQISKIFRKARRKEYQVQFLCFTRRLGTTNTFTASVECCKVDNISTRKSFWEGAGFEMQGNGNDATEVITIKAKEKIEIIVKSLSMGQGKSFFFMEFHPKLDTVESFVVKLPDGQQQCTGSIAISRIISEVDENLSDSTSDLKTRIAAINVKLLKFHADMLNNMDGRSLLSYTRMLKLQESIGEKWWKVLVLMGVPFQTIDKVLKENPGSVDQKVNAMLFDWRESTRHERSRGLPLLLMALSKSDRYGLNKDLQMELRKWKNDPENRHDAFYEWLLMAYKFDLLTPPVYEKPMSDGFLAMLADQINPSIDVAIALNLPQGTVKDLLDKTHIYPVRGLRTMKMLDMFRMGMPDKKIALLELAKALHRIKLRRQLSFLIMSATAWLRRASAGDAMAEDVEQFLQEVVKETGV